MTTKEVFCVECNKEVQARLTDGSEIYQSRSDLASLPFWICDGCRNYVGCHHKTKNPTNPLGSIPNDVLRHARKKLHLAVDPLWRDQGLNRKKVYRFISDKLGHDYHAGNTNSLKDVKKVLAIVEGITVRERFSMK